MLNGIILIIAGMIIIFIFLQFVNEKNKKWMKKLGLCGLVSIVIGVGIIGVSVVQSANQKQATISKYQHEISYYRINNLSLINTIKSISNSKKINRNDLKKYINKLSENEINLNKTQIKLDKFKQKN